MTNPPTAPTTFSLREVAPDLEAEVVAEAEAPVVVPELALDPKAVVVGET